MPRENIISSLRGGRRCSSQPNFSKALKRDFDSVSPTSPENIVTLSAMRALLKETMAPVIADLDDVKASAQFTTEKLDEITSLSERMSKMEKENIDLKSKLEKSEARCSTLEDRIILVEGYSRRNNLKFINVADRPTGENCESRVLELCKRFDIDLEEHHIERAHRLGNKNQAKSPILVKFLSYKDRQRVLQEKTRFKQQGILVVEDYPKEVLYRRKMFTPVLKAVYNSTSYKARLQRDKLLLNGKLYSVDELNKLPAHLRPDNLMTVTKENMTAFFSQHSKLSNHYPCVFTLDGVTYRSVEQCLMHKKATLFNDTQTANAILRCHDPADAKTLGKSVHNFKPDVWKVHRDLIMKSAVGTKFTQNQVLAEFLKSSKKNILIEANPFDRYWGVGLSLQDVNI